jgi:hypothetical protein
MKKVVKYVWIVDEKDVEELCNVVNETLCNVVDGELYIEGEFDIMDYDVVIKDEKKDELKTMEELMSVLRN